MDTQRRTYTTLSLVGNGLSNLRWREKILHQLVTIGNYDTLLVHIGTIFFSNSYQPLDTNSLPIVTNWLYTIGSIGK